MEAGFTLIILSIIIRLSFTQQMILIVAFRAILSWRKPVGPRIMRKLWSNITTGQSQKLREQTHDRKGKQTEDNLRERGVESQLRTAAQRGYPEDAEDPMVAPPDYGCTGCIGTKGRAVTSCPRTGCVWIIPLEFEHNKVAERKTDRLLNNSSRPPRTSQTRTPLDTGCEYADPVASSGRLTAYRSGLSPFLNSLEPNRDLICNAGTSNALSVSTHFVSTGVNWHCAMASRSSTFSYAPRSRRHFNACSRGSRTACHGDSLPMTSSMHVTSCSASSTSANIACFSRLRLARPFMIDLHNFPSF